MSFQAEPRILLRREEIAATVIRLAGEIEGDYRGKHLLLIGILKGSFVFLADLVRQLDLSLEVEFVRLASYGSSRESSGKVRIMQGLRAPIKGRDVLVVEDIVDTGLTLAYLMAYLQRRKPASLKLCALLDKPLRRRAPIAIDYLGFTVPDSFLVGYGLDYDEAYRNLPDVCRLEDEG